MCVGMLAPRWGCPRLHSWTTWTLDPGDVSTPVRCARGPGPPWSKRFQAETHSVPWVGVSWDLGEPWWGRGSSVTVDGKYLPWGLNRMGIGSPGLTPPAVSCDPGGTRPGAGSPAATLHRARGGAAGSPLSLTPDYRVSVVADRCCKPGLLLS